MIRKGYSDSFLVRKPAAPQRFGALNMTAALGHLIMRHPDVKNSMEQFLVQHVLPEFSASEPYVRAIVGNDLSMSGTYSLSIPGVRGCRNRGEVCVAMVK